MFRYAESDDRIVYKCKLCKKKANEHKVLRPLLKPLKQDILQPLLHESITDPNYHIKEVLERDFYKQSILPPSMGGDL